MKTFRILLASTALALVTISPPFLTQARADDIQSWDFTLAPDSATPAVPFSGSLIYDATTGLITSVGFTINGSTASLDPTIYADSFAQFNAANGFGQIGGEAGQVSFANADMAPGPSGAPNAESVYIYDSNQLVSGAWTIAPVPEASTIWAGVLLSAPLLVGVLRRFKRVAAC